MKWINLIGDNNFNLSSVKKINHVGSIESYDVSPDRYCVKYPKGHIIYDYDDTIPEEFDEDLRNIEFNACHIITMIYTNASIVKKIIKQKDFPTDIYIDNDFGVIVPIKEFISLGTPLEEENNL